MPVMALHSWEGCGTVSHCSTWLTLWCKIAQKEDMCWHTVRPMGVEKSMHMCRSRTRWAGPESSPTVPMGATGGRAL